MKMKDPTSQFTQSVLLSLLSQLLIALNTSIPTTSLPKVSSNLDTRIGNFLLVSSVASLSIALA